MQLHTPIFFCDRASPGQRDTNENTKELVRQYFPKGTDPSVHSLANYAAFREDSTAVLKRSLGRRTQVEVFTKPSPTMVLVAIDRNGAMPTGQFSISVDAKYSSSRGSLAHAFC